jgi:hypothetical protein
MSENVRRMYCGACGHEEFFVYQADKVSLYIECRSCNSTTVVSFTRPKIELNFGEHSQGILARRDDD